VSRPPKANQPPTSAMARQLVYVALGAMMAATVDGFQPLARPTPTSLWARPSNAAPSVVNAQQLLAGEGTAAARAMALKAASTATPADNSSNGPLAKLLSVMLAAVKLSVAAVTFVPLFVVRLVKRKETKLDESDVAKEEVTEPEFAATASIKQMKEEETPTTTASATTTTTAATKKPTPPKRTPNPLFAKTTATTTTTKATKKEPKVETVKKAVVEEAVEEAIAEAKVEAKDAAVKKVEAKKKVAAKATEKLSLSDKVAEWQKEKFGI